MGSCICVLGVLRFFFHDFSIRFSNCFDVEVFYLLMAIND